MSAAESYWEAVDLGRLPIALVIETPEGVRGIATVVFGREVTKSSDISNPDCNQKERAMSALRASEVAKRRIKEEYADIKFAPTANGGDIF